MSNASFIFTGRVESIGKSNLDGVDADENMVIMDIQEVVVAPRDLGKLVGKKVTVYMQSTLGLKRGQLLTIFGKSWHYGKNIGIIEVDRSAVDAKRIREGAISELIRQLDEEIKERIRKAKLIISGRVISTYRAEGISDFPGIDEGVEWWQAEMWIKTVEKGMPPEDLRIYFPIGGEINLTDCPKCYPGQEGVWILTPVPKQERADIKTRFTRNTKRSEEEPLMARKPIDYHAISALQRIQSLMWSMEKE
jgi:hypothetical protein